MILAAMEEADFSAFYRLQIAQQNMNGSKSINLRVELASIIGKRAKMREWSSGYLCLKQRSVVKLSNVEFVPMLMQITEKVSGGCT